MKKNVEKYFNILTTEGSAEASMFLYNYIGEEYTYNDGGMEETGTTDIAFVTEFNRLAAQYPVINIRINSYGGEIFHGAAIVNAILNAPDTVEVHTWCDGLAASMAAGIFLAGKHRHMAQNATMMLHSASMLCMGNARDMRTKADALDKFDQSLILGISAGTGVPADEIRSNYFDYTDHWLTYPEALEAGFVTEAAEYKAENVPTNLAGMKYADLVAHFKREQHPEAIGLLERITNAFKSTIKAITSPNNNIDMTIEEFKTSVADGTLKLADIQAHLESLPPAAPPAPPAAPTPTADASEMEYLKAQVADLKAQVTAFGKLPGASRSQPEKPEQDHAAADGSETPQAKYDRVNAELAAAADKNEPAKFVIQ